MKKICLVLLAPALLAGCSEPVSEPVEVVAEPVELVYPVTDKVDHVDSYHGTDVADSFRWLEDDVRESEAVSSWVSAQNEVTFAYLDTIEERGAINSRMKELWDYERYSLPEKEGGRYFYSYNNGLQNQDIIYTQTDLDAEPELLIDPNLWSEDGAPSIRA